MEPDLEQILAACGSEATSALLGECTADRIEHAALDWLRHWGPTGLTPRPPTCTCAQGACRICN